jgi:hypothetical protein
MSSPREVGFRRFMRIPEPVHASAMLKVLRHPLLAWALPRPIIAQHMIAEREPLERCAPGRRCVVEIHMAEGASALASAVCADSIAKEGPLD